MGPLAGIRVVELSSEWTGFAGLLVAGMGASVTVVEPRAGSPTRAYGPFVDDTPRPDRSLWWRYYNRGKTGVRLDLHDLEDRQAFDALLVDADVVIEGEPSAELVALGLDRESVAAAHPRLVWASVTPFGRASHREGQTETDLTLNARGGPMWSCGYDDHELPPMRGGEGQAGHIGGYHAVVGLLVAVLQQQRTGRGQHVDVSIDSALNVTTEAATYEWFTRRATVQRQTGRHAMVTLTQPTQVLAADGRYVNTGVPRADVPTCRALLGWLVDLGCRDEFPEVALLQLGADGDLALHEADMRSEVLGVQRLCATFIAGRLSAYDFFVQAQQRGFTGAAVNAAEDLVDDPHMRARGMWEEVDEPDLGRTVTYPAAPVMFGDGRPPLGPAPS